MGDGGVRALEAGGDSGRAGQLGSQAPHGTRECLDLGRKCRMRAGRPGTDGVATSTSPQVCDPGRVAVGWGASGGGGGGETRGVLGLQRLLKRSTRAASALCWGKGSLPCRAIPTGWHREEGVPERERLQRCNDLRSRAKKDGQVGGGT